jgi:formamidase
MEGSHTKLKQTLINVDITKSVEDQPVPLHNRWHPDIPPVASTEPGTIFRVECVDWTGGYVKNNDSAEDIKSIDLNMVHYLSGPIRVEGAEPGDLLLVELLDMGALPGNEWGFTGIFDKNNGGGFLTDDYPDAAKAIWDFEGKYAVSRHIPGVRFTGYIHPGLIGCAPDHELLEKWTTREE